VLPQRLCGRDHAPCDTRLHRPSLPIRCRDELLPSAPAVRAVCDGLPRPPTTCLATGRGARSSMLSTDFCFPLLSTTSTRVPFVPSFSSRLAPRPFARGLAPWMTETGGPGGSQRPIRFGGQRRVGSRRSSSARSRSHRTSDIPVASPWLRFACAKRESASQPRPCFAGVP